MDEQEAVDDLNRQLRDLERAFHEFGKVDPEGTMLSHIMSGTFQLSEPLKLVIGYAALGFVINDRESENSTLMQKFEADVAHARMETQRRQDRIKEALGELKDLHNKYRGRG